MFVSTKDRELKTNNVLHTTQEAESRMTSISLLAIDDNDDYVSLLKFFLELNTDWKIITALNGIEGIAKARREQPDLILLDIAMPILNGVTVYEMLKCDLTTCSLPVIFITAMVGVEKTVRLEVGEDVKVITKPMDLTVLKYQISDLCNQYLFLN